VGFSLKSLFGRKKEESSSDDIFVIVGLGNPGLKYCGTRHNIGFWLIDVILDKWKGDKFFKNKFDAEICKLTINRKTVFLVKPLTYMNLSGRSVKKIVSFYKIKPEKNLVVISDDIDLQVAKLRIRTSGSSGGHKGIHSIINELGTESFIRFRIGVGRPDYEAETYVLSKIPDDQKPLFLNTFLLSLQALELIIDGKVVEAMSYFNKKDVNEC